MSPSDPATPKKAKKHKPDKKQLTVAPPPRPALRRAVDADVHPVTGRSAPAPTPSGKTFAPTKGGPTTADALMGPAKDKLVDLGVRVPKSVRKRLRQQAKARGVSVDDLVASILSAALPR